MRDRCRMGRAPAKPIIERPPQRDGFRIRSTHPSVTGLEWSIPLRCPIAGYLLLSGVGAWPPPDGVREDRPTNLRARASEHWMGCGLACPSSRRGDFASGRLVSYSPKTFDLSFS